MDNNLRWLGEVLATKGVADRMESDSDFQAFVHESLNRYMNKNWGDSPEKDKEQNDESLKNGESILAVYKRPGHEEDTIWIITEWDRSVTTILFPHEY